MFSIIFSFVCTLLLLYFGNFLTNLHAQLRWQLAVINFRSTQYPDTPLPAFLPPSLSRLATGIITWHLYFVFCLIIWQISWKICLNSRCRFELFLHLHKLINSNDVFIINYYMRNTIKTSKWLSYTLSLSLSLPPLLIRLSDFNLLLLAWKFPAQFKQFTSKLFQGSHLNFIKIFRNSFINLHKKRERLKKEQNWLVFFSFFMRLFAFYAI